MGKITDPRSMKAEQIAGVSKFLNPLYIAGVEVTQAIQYHRAEEHLDDSKDRGADNSLRLVADKPAVVRVYAHSIRNLTGIRGTVTVQRRKYGVWVDGEQLAARGPATVTAFWDAPYGSERANWRSSLNFLIPGDRMKGEMRFKVHVEQTGHSENAADDATTIVRATLRQTLRLRGVPVRYMGPDAAGKAIDLAAPTLAQVTSSCAWTCNTWPVSPRPDVSLAGVFTWSNPLTGNMSGGHCPTSWTDLLYWLQIARVLDGDRKDCFYYAFLPSGVPIGDTGGCGSADGVGAGFVGNGSTLAHELGHVLHFSHVFGNLPVDDNGWDRSYPAYEPHDTETARRGSIGEYGLDVTTSTVMDPTWSTDFMGYGPNSWISPYRHRQLIEHPRLGPQYISLPKDSFPGLDEEYREWPPGVPGPPDPPWGELDRIVRPVESSPLVVALGRLADGQVDMTHLLRLEAMPIPDGARVAGLEVQLLSSDGDVLSRGPVHQLPTRASGGGCGCDGGDDGESDHLLQAKVPDPGPETRIDAVRVMRGDEEVWRRDAPSRAPQVSDVEVKVDDSEVYVRWTTELGDPENRLDRFVRWSPDGTDWNLLGLGVDSDEVVAPIEAIPAGAAVIQVMVTDGFHTVTSDPVRIKVPGRAPSVAIMWPRPEAPVNADEPLRLWGVITGDDGEAVDDSDVEWLIDGEQVATGTDQWMTPGPRAGEHTLLLRTHDRQERGALSAETEVVFRAAGRERTEE